MGAPLTHFSRAFCALLSSTLRRDMALFALPPWSCASPSSASSLATLFCRETLISRSTDSVFMWKKKKRMRVQ